MTAQTALYDSILDDVIALTNRPDLTTETGVAIRAATISVHSKAAYPRDLMTQLVKIPNASYLTSIDAQLLLPRLRGLSRIQLVDASYAPLEFPEIAVIEIDDIRDEEYKVYRNNVAYIAGTAVNVRSTSLGYGFLVEYFQLPNVRRDSYNSWIAQLAPDVIVYTAAALVFATNGNEEKSKSYMSLVNSTLQPEMLANFLTSITR